MVKEKYYRYSGGKIVRHDTSKDLFYSLDENGVWQLDGHAMSKYFDSASEFVEIRNDLEFLFSLDETQQKYYRYSGGKIVKHDTSKDLFYSLDENGVWQLDGHAMSKYFDSASEFVEINNPILNMPDLGGRNR